MVAIFQLRGEGCRNIFWEESGLGDFFFCRQQARRRGGAPRGIPQPFETAGRDCRKPTAVLPLLLLLLRLLLWLPCVRFRGA